MTRLSRLILLCSALALPSATEAGRFEPAGTMSVARAFHTSTLLDDGRVLLAGGTDVAGDTAEIYDPESGRFTALPAMPVARSSHAAMKLRDGRILLVGGDRPGLRPAHAVLFDPAQNRFEITGALATAQAAPAVALLPDGRVLVVGGQQPGLGHEVKSAPAEIYDPSRGSFSRAPAALPSTLYPDAGGPLWPTATALVDGRVFVHGNREAQLFDPARETFDAAGPTRDERLAFGSFWHTSTALLDGQVLVTGGHDEIVMSRNAQRFDPASGRFRSVRAMRDVRALHTATPLLDGSVLVVGGETFLTGADGSFWFGGSLASSERFDPRTDRFLPDAKMARPRTGHAATRLADGRVLVTGGIGYFAFPAALAPDRFDDAELYVPDPPCGKARRCLAK